MLRRLLDSGASPDELLAVLQRRELIQPLPDYAHLEVHEMLDDAIAQLAAQNLEAEPAADAAPAPVPLDTRESDERMAQLGADTEALTRAYERARDAGSAAASRVNALTAELAAARTELESERAKNQQAEAALAERIQSERTAQARTEQVLVDSAQVQAELDAARVSLSAREGAFAALYDEHIKWGSARDANAADAQRLQCELDTSRAQAELLAAELAAAKSSLSAEQSKAQESSARSFAMHGAEVEALQRDQSRALATHGAEVEALRQDQSKALAARCAEIDALRHDQAKAIAALEARMQARSSELLASQRQVETLAAELKASREAASSLKSQHRQDESHLIALAAKLAAAEARSSTYLESLQSRAWRREYDRTAVVEMSAISDAREAELATLRIERDALRVAASAARTPSMPPNEPEAPAPAVSIIPTPPPREPRVPPPASVAAATPTAARIVTATPVSTLSSPAVEIPQRAVPCADAPRPTLAETPKSRSINPVIAWGAVVIGVVFIAIFLAMRPKAPAPVPAAVLTAGTLVRDCPNCPAMTVLQPGRFRQGAIALDGAAVPASEKPTRWVLIGAPFALSVNDVTVDEFRAFAVATGRDMRGCEIYDGDWKMKPEASWENPGFSQSGAHPATCVSWNDAEAYAAWLSAKTGHRYRLPSASEWEYAARAGADAVAPWGAEGSSACGYANVADASAARRFPGWSAFACDDGQEFTAPVGTYKANAWGLSDMLGNVFQWTEDCWHADYRGAPIDGSARKDGDCAQREMRGGSWFTNPAFVRADYRNHFGVDTRTSTAGIRLVRELAPDDAAPIQAARNGG